MAVDGGRRLGKSGSGTGAGDGCGEVAVSIGKWRQNEDEIESKWGRRL